MTQPNADLGVWEGMPSQAESEARIKSFSDPQPKSSDYANYDEYSKASNDWHYRNVNNDEIEALQKQLENQNAQFDSERANLNQEIAGDVAEEAEETEALGGEEEAEAVEAEMGPFGWIGAGITGAIMAATLLAYGYTMYEIEALNRQVAALPPNSAIPLPPPGKVIPPGGTDMKPPKILYFGIDPNLMLNKRKKGKRRFGFM